MESTFSEVDIDTRVCKIIEKIQLAREILEKSVFYKEFMEQMQDPEMVSLIKRTIDSDKDHSQLQIVLYGVGQLEADERSHVQLALAILLREKFEWVYHDIEVYDPVLSPFDQMAINLLNCTSLSINEYCKRTVDRPTLFFMPHLPFDLYMNLLKANWTSDHLNKIIILGGTLTYIMEQFPHHASNEIKALCNSDHALHTIPLPQKPISQEDPFYMYNAGFELLDWQFFAWDDSLEIIDEMAAPREEILRLMEEIELNHSQVGEIMKQIQLAKEKLENLLEQMQDPGNFNG